MTIPLRLLLDLRRHLRQAKRPSSTPRWPVLQPSRTNSKCRWPCATPPHAGPGEGDWRSAPLLPHCSFSRSCLCRRYSPQLSNVDRPLDPRPTRHLQPPPPGLHRRRGGRHRRRCWIRRPSPRVAVGVLELVLPHEPPIGSEEEADRRSLSLAAGSREPGAGEWHGG